VLHPDEIAQAVLHSDRIALKTFIQKHTCDSADFHEAFFYTFTPYTSLKATHLQMRSRNRKNPSKDDSQPVKREPTLHDKITEIFTRILPHVQATIVNTFAGAMQTYYDTFMVHRVRMDYEEAQEYRDASTSLFSVNADEGLWVYTPHFKQIAALVIGELFGTKITAVSMSSSFEKWQTVVLIDTMRNRWTMNFQKTGDTLRVSLMFPFSNTRMSVITSIEAHKLNDELTKPNGVELKAHDIRGWLEEN
jgi:hypothetical protein